MNSTTQFSIRFLLFISVVLLLFVGLEWYNKNRLTYEIPGKLQVVKDNLEGTELFVVGNSHGRDGVIPDSLKIPSVNACMLGSSFFYDKYLIENYLKDAKECKQIILIGSYQTLAYNMAHPKYSKRRHEYYHFIGANYKLDDFDWKKVFLLEVQSFKGGFNNLKRDLTTNKPKLWKTKGYLRNEEQVDTHDIASLAIRKIEKHHILMDNDMVEENLGYLKSIAEWCRERDIKLTLITPPVTSVYNELRKEEYLSFGNIMSAKSKEWNFDYYNFSEDSDFDYSHFKDVDHMNSFGAELFTQKLNQTIF